MPRTTRSEWGARPSRSLVHASRGNPSLPSFAVDIQPVRVVAALAALGSSLTIPTGLWHSAQGCAIQRALAWVPAPNKIPSPPSAGERARVRGNL